MPGRGSGPYAQASVVVIGEIDCEVATSALLEDTDLVGAASHLMVSVPVTVRSAQPKSDLDLVVSARLHAPPGFPVPVAWAPSPSVEYADGQAATSVNVSITPGFGAVSGGVERTARRQELVSNVVGVGTRHVEWSISGRNGHVADSRKFRFFVRHDEARHSWLELTARVSPARGFLRRTSSEAEQRVWAPLVAESSPQAAATLVLLEERDGEAARLYVGRPLDLPLSLTPEGPAVGESGAGGTVVGSFRWFDSIDGRPGFQWVQQSSARVVLGQGLEARPGTPVSVPDGSVLHYPGGHSLRVVYDGALTAGRPTLRETLDVRVVVDDAVVATHRTETGYVTVGRSLKDINVNRPDISRMHGAFELSDSGWSYTHLSGVGDAVLLRGGQPAVTVRRDEPVPVRSRDTVVLNEHVALSIG